MSNVSLTWIKCKTQGSRWVKFTWGGALPGVRTKEFRRGGSEGWGGVSHPEDLPGWNPAAFCLGQRNGHHQWIPRPGKPLITCAVLKILQQLLFIRRQRYQTSAKISIKTLNDEGEAEGRSDWEGRADGGGEGEPFLEGALSGVVGEEGWLVGTRGGGRAFDVDR